MIYFDNAATSKPSSHALEAYLKASEEDFANSGSPHLFAIKSNRLLDNCRREILSVLGLEKTHDILFTSGATEANNLAIKSVGLNYKNRGDKIISDLGEHSSIKNVCHFMEKHGFDLTFLILDANGKIDLEALKNSIDKNTILFAGLSVNNETGAINDPKAIKNILKDYPKCFYLLDATQSIGKENIDLSVADLITFSGHKFGGVKGVGAIIYKKNIKLANLTQGGKQEKGIRPGTVDIPSIYAMSIALKDAVTDQKKNKAYVQTLHDRLVEGLNKNEEIIINSTKEGTPYIVNFSFKRKKASVVIEALGEEGIYLSSHSACDDQTTSCAVLDAMGVEKGLSENSIRCSFSHENTLEEVDIFLNTLNKILQGVRDR